MSGRSVVLHVREAAAVGSAKLFSLWTFLVHKYIDRKIYDDPRLNQPSNVFRRDLLVELCKKGHISDPEPDDVEDWLSMRLEDLVGLVREGRVFDDAELITRLPYPVANECHALSSYYWVLNQELSIYSGLVDGKHYHSWLYSEKNKVIYEPTPYIRGKYFGVKKAPLEFVLSEYDNVFDLCEQKLILGKGQAEYADFFKKLIKDR